MLLDRLVRRILALPPPVAASRAIGTVVERMAARFGLPGQMVRHALSLPLHVALRKGLGYAARTLGARVAGLAGKWRNSYPPARGRLGRLTGAIDLSGVVALAPVLRALGPLALAHRFDLLGSGWVRVAHGDPYGGFGPWRYPPGAPLPARRRIAAVAGEHHPGNRPRARAILALIDDPAWRPIDWHVDFKSGYRWSPATFGASVPFAHRPGVDIKLPWELARLQHLPHLAYARALAAAGAEGFAPPSRWEREFRHQVLDFLGANPPGWGVNWRCAMDVAIRAANILVARELFLAQGVTFDAAFEGELAAAMLAHGRHIVRYLEWHDQHRANHYLADVAGLLFIAAALPRSPETDVWLAFAVHQLDAEPVRQFGADGANFEASTSYHRLSAELALYGAALVLGLPEDGRRALAEYDSRLWTRDPPLPPAPLPRPPLSGAAIDRLARMAGFAATVTKPNGAIVQVGDNDSGRFLKLSPLYDFGGKAGPAERHLDPSGLVAAAKGLFDLALPTPPETALETAFIAALARGTRLPMPDGPGVICRVAGAPAPAGRAARLVRLRLLPAESTSLAGLDSIAYPEFGLFLWKGRRAFLSFRCGPIGQNGNGGHAHNDQLAVELEIDGVAWARDPGTFVYTPDLAARTRYRSALAHFVPRDGTAEPARLDLGPFRLEDRAKARLIRFDAEEIAGWHAGFGAPTLRRVRIADGAIVIEDLHGGGEAGPDTVVEEHTVRAPEDLARLWGLDLPFSAGYGLQVPPPKIMT